MEVRLRCKMCSNKLNDPYMCMYCQIPYCSTCIINYVNTNICCPDCQRTTRENNLLKYRIEIERSEESSKNIPFQKCLIHANEKLDLFCNDHKIPLCWNCSLKSHQQCASVMQLKPPLKNNEKIYIEYYLKFLSDLKGLLNTANDKIEKPKLPSPPDGNVFVFPKEL